MTTTTSLPPTPFGVQGAGVPGRLAARHQEHRGQAGLHDRHRCALHAVLGTPRFACSVLCVLCFACRVVLCQGSQAQHAVAGGELKREGWQPSALSMLGICLTQLVCNWAASHALCWLLCCAVCAGLHTIMFFIYLLLLGIDAWKASGLARSTVCMPGSGWGGGCVGVSAAITCLQREGCLIQPPSARPFASPHPMHYPLTSPLTMRTLPPHPWLQVFVATVPVLSALSFALGSTIKQAVDNSVFLFVSPFWGGGRGGFHVFL